MTLISPNPNIICKLSPHAPEGTTKDENIKLSPSPCPSPSRGEGVNFPSPSRGEGRGGGEKGYYRAKIIKKGELLWQDVYEEK
jgi:hypothetical protein